MKFRVLTCLSLLFALTLPAQQVKLNKGDFEIATSGLLDQSELGGTLRFGAFVQDYIQIGLDLEYQGNDFLDRFSVGAFGLMLIETETYLLPYVGGSLSLASLNPDGDSGNSGMAFALIGGLKYYLADNVALNGELLIGVSSDDTYLDSGKASDTYVGLRFGFSYLW